MSSTTGDEQPAISSAEGYEQGEDYSSNAGIYYAQVIRIEVHCKFKGALSCFFGPL